MSQIEMELLVERFLACEMNLDEEREFIMHTATNAELFRTLRAYRLMEHALARNRESLPGGDAAVHSHALALVGRAPAATVQASSPSPALPAASRFMTQWRSVAVAAIVSTIAGFFLHDLIVHPSPAGPAAVGSVAAPQQAPAPPPPQEPASAPVTGLDRAQGPDATAPEFNGGNQTGTAAATARARQAARAPENANDVAQDRATAPPTATVAPLGRDSTDRVPPAGADQRRDTTRPDSVSFRAKIIVPKP